MPRPKLRIGIICPKGVRTGGPEALHQLCDSLRRQNVEANLLNLGNDVRPAEEYSHYDAPWMPVSEVSSVDVLVTPESCLRLPRWLRRDFHGLVAIWWLSVDNAYHQKARNFEVRRFPLRNPSWGWSRRKAITLLLLGGEKSLRARIFALLQFALPMKLKPQQSLNFAQSNYAREFLIKELDVTSTLLTDFISRPEAELAPLGNRDYVAFNPAKGGPLALKVSRLLPDRKFVPLVGMTREEVRGTLAGAGLYLDLGHFPGMDRLPREAALMSTPVLLAKRGSARFREDFPLPEEFFVDLEVMSPADVAERIESVLASREDAIDAQADFWRYVQEDKNRFDRQVGEFIAIATKRIESS